MKTIIHFHLILAFLAERQTLSSRLLPYQTTVGMQKSHPISVSAITLSARNIYFPVY